MKTLLRFVISCLLVVGSSPASQITRNTTLSDGQQLYASDLHNLIDTATIGTGFYEDADSSTVLGVGYYVLFVDPSTHTFKRMDATKAFYANTNLFLNVSIRTLPGYGSLLFYDPTNNWLGRITSSNLFWGQSSNIQVSAMSFGDTNGYRLATWTNTFSGFQTNNHPAGLWWGTNGVPLQVTLSNLEAVLAFDLGTNRMVSHIWTNIFQPWTYQGTNIATNIWALASTIAITNSYLGTNTNDLAILATDTLPIQSGRFGTNTTVTLGALYAYLTNLNTLPAYTQARIQFSGIPLSLNISNTADTVNELIRIQTNNTFTAGNTYAFSVITNGTAQWSGMQTNTVYYAVPTVTNVGWCRVYTNYTDATNSSTNFVDITASGSGTLNKLLYLTNFTSYNADVIQTAAGASAKTAIYDVVFRTPAANANYYVSGMPMAYGTAAGGMCLNLLGGTVPTTNSVRICTIRVDAEFIEVPRIHVLINPE